MQFDSKKKQQKIVGRNSPMLNLISFLAAWYIFKSEHELKCHKFIFILSL